MNRKLNPLNKKYLKVFWLIKEMEKTIIFAKPVLKHQTIKNPNIATIHQINQANQTIW